MTTKPPNDPNSTHYDPPEIDEIDEMRRRTDRICEFFGIGTDFPPVREIFTSWVEEP